MRLALLPTLLAMPLAACGGGAASNDQQAAANAQTETAASAPEIRLPIIAGRPGAGYFELREIADRGALLAVTSPQIGRIEMHETVMTGTTSSMRPIERAVPENGTLRFTSGAKHLMLYEIDPALQPSGQTQLTFRFEQGEPMTLTARVVSMADGGGHEGH